MGGSKRCVGGEVDVDAPDVEFIKVASNFIRQ